MPEPLKLAVCFGPGGSLEKYDQSGILDREMALYRGLQARGMEISVVSYGGREEYAFSSRVPGIRILCNSFGLPNAFYERRVHQAHGLQFLRTDIVKSSDASGLNGALRINWAWNIPFVFRMSYIWSELVKITDPKETRHAERIGGLERKALERAHLVSVTTKYIAETMTEKVPSIATKVSVVPSYVDTDRFQPVIAEKRYDLAYVGRISVEKNLGALLEAVEQLGLSIAMIGGAKSAGLRGQVDDEIIRLKERFGDLNGRINWLGVVKNEDLPLLVSQARAFVLCSLSEGQPRALIEAMACGMPIIGTKVPGIENQLEHKVTGYLCDTDAESLARAIDTVLSQPELMRKMGENARRHALEHYSLEALAQREFELLQEVAKQNPVRSAKRQLLQYLLRRNNLGLQM